MATDANLTTALANATALVSSGVLTSAAILSLCDRAVADLLASRTASYTYGSRTVAFANLATVQGVREYYQGLVDRSSNCIAMNLAEL